MPLGGSDREWLAEVRRYAGMIESGEVEASAPLRESIAYILEDPERTIAESEAALADPDVRTSLDEYLAREARGEREPGYTTEEVLRYLRERGLKLDENDDRTPSASRAGGLLARRRLASRRRRPGWPRLAPGRSPQ